MLRKNILLAIVVFFTLQINAQLTVKKSSLDSGGAIVENNGLMMLYTVGEVAVSENDNGFIHISEGFISPEIMSVVGVEGYELLQGVQVFPNPSSNFISIKLTEKTRFSVVLYSLNGKCIFDKEFIDKDFISIDISSILKSQYILVIKDQGTLRYKTVKLLLK